MVEGLGNSGGSNGNGIAFLVSAGVMYEIIAAACSSPQTTELNAAARSDTLMKWVNLGVAQGLVFVAIAAYFDRAHRTPIIAGAVLASALLYGQYVHARNAGLQNGGPPTETYAPSSRGQAPTGAVSVPLAAYA